MMSHDTMLPSPCRARLRNPHRRHRSRTAHPYTLLPPSKVSRLRTNDTFSQNDNRPYYQHTYAFKKLSQYKKILKDSFLTHSYTSCVYFARVQSEHIYNL